MINRTRNSPQLISIQHDHEGLIWLTQNNERQMITSCNNCWKLLSACLFRSTNRHNTSLFILPGNRYFYCISFSFFFCSSNTNYNQINYICITQCPQVFLFVCISRQWIRCDRNEFYGLHHFSFLLRKKYILLRLFALVRKWIKFGNHFIALLVIFPLLLNVRASCLMHRFVFHCIQSFKSDDLCISQCSIEITSSNHC